MDIYGLSNFPGLVVVPAFSALSSLRISVEESRSGSPSTDVLVYAESDGGFQLSYSTTDGYEATADWLGVMDKANPSLDFVRFEGPKLGPMASENQASPLALFGNAKVLEIGASFAGLWYPDFWEDLGEVGPRLTTLRLEVIEGMKPTVATSVEKFVRSRFNKGAPLAKLESMTFERMIGEEEEKAKKLWKRFRALLNIDQCLASQ